MLLQTKDLQDLAIGATDGKIGDVKDIYFDDKAWVIRYLVVDTGSWLSSRKVLISPIATGQPDWSTKLLPVSLTREQVKNSPDIDTDMPVTRQHEANYHDYYIYPYYWGDVGLWGLGGYANVQMPDDNSSAQTRTEAHQSDSDPHLRSCKAVVGYSIEASDGEIGHVHGMLVDDESWSIRYLVVNTSNWWFGHDVLVAPQWIKRVSWAQRCVAVDLTLDALKQAPKYDPALPLSREMEIAVFTHYGRAGYWPAAAPDA